MKPTTRQILSLLQRHQGLWVSHADLAIVGGHRYGGRIFELREARHRISQEGQGERSRYRYDGPPDPGYARFSCACGWAGSELSAHRTYQWFQCPQCQRTLPTVARPPVGYQEALL